ncbi:hypothetical protein KKF82_04695 [Patescibacteria group bacterium]|nr:hypothetical protein [Patescibacteria group bacterium]
MKLCAKCGQLKEFAEFNKDKSRKDGHQSYCRKCSNELRMKQARTHGALPMSDNKKCSAYLGVAIAEQLIRHLFKNVIRMPYGHPGFDFRCAKDKKIDVKSACITLNYKKYPRWKFFIKKNKVADYFLLMAFSNRSDLEPKHQWLIPGTQLNDLALASISPSTIDKWKIYEQPINAAITCCNTIKNQSH